MSTDVVGKLGCEFDSWDALDGVIGTNKNPPVHAI